MEDIFKPKALLLHYSIFLPTGVCISLLLDIFHCDLCFTSLPETLLEAHLISFINLKFCMYLHVI